MKKQKKKRASAHIKHLTKTVASVAISVLLFGGVFYSYAATPPHPKTMPRPTTTISHHPLSTSSSSKHADPATKPPPVTTTAPAPAATTPQPAATPKPASQPAASTTVVPAPTSSVDSLTPTSVPATQPSTPTADPGTTSTNTSPILPAASYTSTNWSGYLSSGGVYTAVSGSWVAPAVTGNTTTESGDAAWIGIGGVTSDDLIQIGTENIVEPDGQVYTGAFYELLPDVSQPVPGVTVHAGDSVSASISQVSSTRWTMSITDQTTGQSYTSTVTYTSTNSSAEWVEEDPSYASGSLVPFDNFGTIAFTNASTTANGTAMSIASAQGSIITMIANPGHVVVAQPSALGSDGASFSVTRKN